MTSPAQAAVGRPCGGVPEDRVLLILAIDHHASLERDLYGLTAPPTPAQAARISADKLLVYQALLHAAGQLPANVQPGVLIDEQYGASVAELATQPCVPASQNTANRPASAQRALLVGGRYTGQVLWTCGCFPALGGGGCCEVHVRR